MPRADLSRTWLSRYGLTVVFLFACVVMSLLVIEQGRIIDSQRRLIHDLFRDSMELNQAKQRQAP